MCHGINIWNGRVFFMHSWSVIKSSKFSITLYLVFAKMHLIAIMLSQENVKKEKKKKSKYELISVFISDSIYRKLTSL